MANKDLGETDDLASNNSPWLVDARGDNPRSTSILSADEALYGYFHGLLFEANASDADLSNEPSPDLGELAYHSSNASDLPPDNTDNNFVASQNPTVARVKAATPDLAPIPYFQPSRKSLLSVDQIPSDVPLDLVQKRQLQALLDQSLLTQSAMPQASPEPEFTTAEPAKISAAALDVAETSVTVADQDVAIDATEDDTPTIEEYQSVVDKEDEADAVAPQTRFDQGRPNAVLADTAPNFRPHWHNGIPDWAGKQFDLLLFSSRGVTLAIPLLTLGKIYQNDEPLNKVPGMPRWVLGVKPVLGQKLKVIDAGEFFIPSRPAGDHPPSHLLSLAETDWAFAIDSVDNPITVRMDEVQWRSLNPQNPWLAGAVKQFVCVLIDTPSLILQLDRI